MIMNSWNSRTADNNDTCQALYVKCTNSIYDSKKILEKVQNKHEIGENTKQDIIHSPWNADIYSDGNYTCSGILISLEWIVVSEKCVENME